MCQVRSIERELAKSERIVPAIVSAINHLPQAWSGNDRHANKHASDATGLPHPVDAITEEQNTKTDDAVPVETVE